ncbi:MAG: MarR family winged helix-turn-helix transcriptional regulator [Gammaproteobacteria bacterium]|nr:MarR family winged helix-turn-helix transcriptional regulator [Gammaproteobacteria bacterium]
MNFSFKRHEDSPGFLLWQLTNQWQRQQRQALAKLGLTHPQFVVLAGVLWLSSLPDNVVTQKQVCELTKIDKMSMSDLTAILLKKKMLKRLSHAEDGRAHALMLTDKGRSVVLKAIPVVEGIDANFFSKKTLNLVQLVRNLKHLI